MKKSNIDLHNVASKLYSILDVITAPNIPNQSRIDVCRAAVYELSKILNKIIHEQENRKN